MRDENKEKLIQDALNMLDDELILEADEIREKSVNTTIEHSSTTILTVEYLSHKEPPPKQHILLQCLFLSYHFSV